MEPLELLVVRGAVNGIEDVSLNYGKTAADDSVRFAHAMASDTGDAFT
jgi:hypothetical protein